MMKFGRMNAQPPAHAPPEATSDVRDPDADLDRERPGQGLADRDAFPHFFLRQPFLLAYELALHLTDQRNWSAKTKNAEAQVVANEIANRDPAGRGFGCH